MQRNRNWYSTMPILAVLSVTALFATSARADETAAASTAKVIYSFAGDNDGEYTDTDLVMDSKGNLFGTTVQGGAFDTGTVFQLAPSGSTWIHTVLYSFTGGADGGQPYKGVTLDSAGNLYGTAVVGGKGGACESGCGVVYKLGKSGTKWTQSVLYSFTGGTDGYGPGSGLTFDKQGNLYGMTPVGGANGWGVIFELKPGQSSQWTFTVIHPFTGGNDGGSGSAGRFIFDSSGNFYGVATAGGAHQSGTAYELSPTQTGSWKFTTLYTFKGQPDAGFPYGGLAFDKAGNLYGTTYYDGANDVGSVYKLTHNGNAWSETVLYSFKGGSDGNGSIGNVNFDAAGNLYGTTSEGGARCSCGTIFKLTPGAGGKWTESVPYKFTDTPDAGYAYNGMVAGSAGTFYGATVHGGANNDGAIYKFTP
jgi:uncharacterized repeat protein (TIGR03803 family)